MREVSLAITKEDNYPRGVAVNLSHNLDLSLSFQFIYLVDALWQYHIRYFLAVG